MTAVRVAGVLLAVVVAAAAGVYVVVAAAQTVAEHHLDDINDEEPPSCSWTEAAAVPLGGRGFGLRLDRAAGAWRSAAGAERVEGSS